MVHFFDGGFPVEPPDGANLRRRLDAGNEDTWEARMSARAKERQLAQEAEEWLVLRTAAHTETTDD